MRAWCPASGRPSKDTGRSVCPRCGRRIATVAGRLRKHRLPPYEGALTPRDRKVGLRGVQQAKEALERSSRDCHPRVAEVR